MRQDRLFRNHEPRSKEEIEAAIKENRAQMARTTQALTQAAAEAAQGCYKSRWPRIMNGIALASGASQADIDTAIEAKRPKIFPR